MSETDKTSTKKKTGWMNRLFGQSTDAQPQTHTETPAQTQPKTIAQEVPGTVAATAADTDLPAPSTSKAASSTPAAQPSAPKSWFGRLTSGLKKSASALAGGIGSLFSGRKKLDEATLEELEDLLITSDLGVRVAAKLTESLRSRHYDKDVDAEDIRSLFIDEITALLTPVAKPLEIKAENKPHIILMAGVNGAGKTTTIGKLAKQYHDAGLKVMLAAGDTFRAAAVEQLSVWGVRVGVPVVTKDTGADAAALAYEAVDRAVAEKMDVLLIDTAGRLQNRKELMEELAKVVRVIGKKIDGAPHDTVIVLDATTGQNAVHQVDVFQSIANISGIIMTKLDGSAKGGVLVACAEKFALPIHAVGVGEAIEDLAPFKPEEFAAALLSDNS